MLHFKYAKWPNFDNSTFKELRDIHGRVILETTKYDPFWSEFPDCPDELQGFNIGRANTYLRSWEDNLTPVLFMIVTTVLSTLLGALRQTNRSGLGLPMSSKTSRIAIYRLLCIMLFV